MSKNNKASNYNEKMLTRLRIQFIVLSMAVVIIMQGFIVYTSVRNTYNKWSLNPTISFHLYILIF